MIHNELGYMAEIEEQCSNCSQPLGTGGAWYYERRRFCKLCYEDHLDWDEYCEREEKQHVMQKASGLLLIGLALLIVGKVLLVWLG